MDPLQEEIAEQRIQTTLGDLICAIADAAREATIDEEELTLLTHDVLISLLKREHRPKDGDS